MVAVDIRGLTLCFNGQPLFADFDFSLLQHQWTVLLGRSGVGKSTLLRAIAGLENDAVQQGEIVFPRPLKLAWLAQQDSLYPWLSIMDNVQLQHHLTGTKTAETTAQAEQLLAAVQMGAHRHKPCYQLSGGQRQRVALARTLMQHADLILMDEPFSALDAVTRLQLQDLACDLLRDKTVLLITHDPQEAIRLADRIAILHDPTQPIEDLIEAKTQLENTPKPRQANAQTLALQQDLFDRLMQGGMS